MSSLITLISKMTQIAIYKTLVRAKEGENNADASFA